MSIAEQYFPILHAVTKLRHSPFAALLALFSGAPLALAILLSSSPVVAQEPYQIEVYAPNGIASKHPPAQPPDDGLKPMWRVSSLQQALVVARSVRRRFGTSLQIIIALQPGVHRLGSAARIGPFLSGIAGKPLVITGGTPGLEGRVIISGAANLRPLAKSQIKFDRSRLPALARNNVVVYRLPIFAGLARNIGLSRYHRRRSGAMPFEIFDQGGALWPARWPNVDAKNRGWTTGTPVFKDEAARMMHIYPVPASHKTWWRETDAWAQGYLRFNYSYRAVRFTKLNPAGGDAVLGTIAEELIYGMRKNFRFYLSHLAAELDQPGEWYRDKTTGELIVYPRNPGPRKLGPRKLGPRKLGPRKNSKKQLEISVAQNLIVVDKARHIRIENLTLEKARGDLIRVNGGTGVVIADSALRLAGSRAASFTGGTRNGIRGCRITDTGEGGVSLIGGDRRNLRASGLFVADSVIRRFSRLGISYRPAVYLDGVGQIVIGNAISHSPHMAIYFQGNDHLIEYNEISNVVSDAADAGAIYTGRDWTARGTRIRYNFLHDIRGGTRDLGGGRNYDVKGVYLDDIASDIDVVGNVFLRVDQPVFIGGGRYHKVTDNVFLGSVPGISLDARGLTFERKDIFNLKGEERTSLRAMPYMSATWRLRYPRLPNLLLNRPDLPMGNIFRNNLLPDRKAFYFEHEIDATVMKQINITLKPNMTYSASRSSVQSLARRAITAADLAKFITPHRRRTGLPALPLAKMDRERALRNIRAKAQR